MNGEDMRREVLRIIDHHVETVKGLEKHGWAKRKWILARLYAIKSAVQIIGKD